MVYRVAYEFGPWASEGFGSRFSRVMNFKQAKVCGFP